MPESRSHGRHVSSIVRGPVGLWEHLTLPFDPPSPTGRGTSIKPNVLLRPEILVKLRWSRPSWCPALDIRRGQLKTSRPDGHPGPFTPTGRTPHVRPSPGTPPPLRYHVGQRARGSRGLRNLYLEGLHRRRRPCGPSTSWTLHLGDESRTGSGESGSGASS